MANCNELPLVFLDENTLLVHHAKLKTTIVYFIITCQGKMVHAFASLSVIVTRPSRFALGSGYARLVSSVVGDTTNIKMFGVLPLT